MRGTSENLFVSAMNEERGGSLMESIPQIAGELVDHLDDLSAWEEEVNALSQRIASEVGSMVMRAMDDALL